MSPYVVATRGTWAGLRPSRRNAGRWARAPLAPRPSGWRRHSTPISGLVKRGAPISAATPRQWTQSDHASQRRLRPPPWGAGGENSNLFVRAKLNSNLKTIVGLDTIKEDGEGLKIGALARLSDVADSAVVRGKWKIVADSAASVGSIQIRQ